MPKIKNKQINNANDKKELKTYIKKKDDDQNKISSTVKVEWGLFILEL